MQLWPLGQSPPHSGNESPQSSAAGGWHTHSPPRLSHTRPPGQVPPHAGALSAHSAGGNVVAVVVQFEPTGGSQTRVGSSAQVGVAAKLTIARTGPGSPAAALMATLLVLLSQSDRSLSASVDAVIFGER